MIALLPLVVALPLAGFLALVFWPRLPKPAAGVIGAGSVGAAMVVALLVGVSFLASPPPGHAATAVV